MKRYTADFATMWNGLDIDAVAAMLDSFIPEDDFPSATQAGALDFLVGVLRERPEWLPRIAAAVDGEQEPRRWLADLVQAGYYGDPGQGGNLRAKSWEMVGWSPGPPGWPPADAEQLRPRSTRLDAIRGSFDAIVIGSGAGGGSAAAVLADAGMRVLVVERGDGPSAAYLHSDHLRNARVSFGLQDRTLPRDIHEPRIVSGRLTAPSERRWGPNASTIGGGTRIYGAQAWRFHPTDFAMATRYGTPQGSSLVDWPFGYADLEPWYDVAERAFGVAGEVDPSGGFRSGAFPMDPMPRARPALVLAEGARTLGWDTVAVPLAVNSEPYGGRAACARCAQCVGFACPVDAKGGSQNTVLRSALDTGRADVVRLTRAVRITTDGAGRVDGVVLVDEETLERREVKTGLVVIAAGAVETARLLLASPSDREPHGLGNSSDQVGRNLQGHLYAGALGLFEDEVNDWLGPGPAIATTRFRHDLDGFVGGGMIANEFVPTPAEAFTYLRGSGLLPDWGIEAKHAMRWMVRRMQRIVGPVHEVTRSESRVRIDTSRTDRLGMPLAMLDGDNHPEDRRVQAFLSERAAEWLEASGATRVVRWQARAAGWGPSAGQHQAGTMRMGTDPATSATDPHGRVWGHDNLIVADASLHVTNGGVNPFLTAVALSFRSASLAVGRTPAQART